MRLLSGLLIVCIGLGSFSCVSKKKFDELQAAKNATDQALAETQGRVKSLQDENANLQSTMEAEKNRLNGEISSLKNDVNATKGQIAQVQEKLSMTEKELAALRAEIDGIFGAYQKSGLSLEERNGKFYVVTSPVNFKSSGYSLTKDQKSALEQLATTLKNNPSLKILVEGHTDNKQFASGGRDNWDLSLDRALSVVRQLVKNGVSPSQVAAVGRGEHEPSASNDTDEGRSQNRRSSVLPDPQLGTILKKKN